jgi:site-specific DNA recombinase
MMNKKTRTGSTAVADAAEAITYARVSSKEQDREGFSIPAQQKLLSNYALTNQLTIVEEYVDVETAKHTGRTKFEEIVRYLRSHTNIRIVLEGVLDRRNASKSGRKTKRNCILRADQVRALWLRLGRRA